ncbi:TIGR02588 family protein [Kineococcus arenarius]|uniref:TIGR02588 family protein n=1 Tax=Kineococcus sp. SYSU DK007 TaxID=3383128 RepID=UPI003D7E0187
MEQQEQQEQQPGGRERLNRLETVLGALGGALVVALLAHLGHEALTRGSAPRLQAKVQDVSRVPGGFAVQVEIVNSGGRTAQDVQVSGEVVSGDQTLSEATATVTYVPAESRRHLVLVLATDPADGRLQVRAEGYAVP